MRDKKNGRVEWRFVLLAAVIFVVAGALLAGLWQIGRIVAQPAGGTGTATASGGTPAATETATARPSPISTPSVTVTPSATAPTEVTISGVRAEVDAQRQAIDLEMTARAPAGREIAAALLWYDTEAGHQVRGFHGPLPETTTLTYTILAAQEGLTTTQTSGELDYWWQVTDTAGETARSGGTVSLGPALEPLVATPAPAPPPISFTWAVSSSAHFQFNYVPGTEAERDLAGIARMAEASLNVITPTLQHELTGTITVFLTPRVFWQGGAAYGDKRILISYLDRNYTGVETWSYFTHEGTHALAQDFIQPKAEEGGPDGVLVEGLAVWASGGHYAIEPIDDWAAVVSESDSYLPLPELRAGPFYDFQHETAYLEGGSFVKFFIERYGLDNFKQLYGRATGKAEHDEALVSELYGQGYAQLEQDWRAHLEGLSPTPEEAEQWWFRVRSFDLMRRYETELDPGARILPGVPTEWTSDTVKIFTERLNTPANLVLETALIAAGERARRGDLAGGSALLDEVEAALNAGGDVTGLPALEARQAILELLARQDRAVRLAGVGAYRDTLDPAFARALGDQVDDVVRPPYTEYWQEVVRLDVADDGQSARGVVALHARLAEGAADRNGQLTAVRFVKGEDGWLMSGREAAEPEIIMPPRATP